MIKLRKQLFTSFPERQKNQFVNELLEKNYSRGKVLSRFMVAMSLLMYLISVIENDLQVIKDFNLAFFGSSTVVLILFVIIKPKKGIITNYHKGLFLLLIVTTLLWSSNLLAFVPDRFELYGTYSIVILSISSIFYLRWKFHLALHLISLVYIFIVFTFMGDFFFLTPVIPKITVIVFLSVFSWGISRLIYYKNLENFELKIELIQKNKEIQLEVNIKTNELFEQHKNQIKDLVLSMNTMLEQYTPYTKGHCENVAVISKKISEDLMMTSFDIQEAYWSAIIHDIGKLLVPLEILNKDTSLSEQEYEIVKKHPVWAYNALKGSKSLYSLSKNVLHHHEYWNGLGYPNGLKKDEIPLISQIISIADAWDAMTSDRPYRKSLKHEQALKIITSNKNKQFSPKIVESFLRVYKLDSNKELF